MKFELGDKKMFQLIITEFIKLKRQSIIWIGIIAVFISAILATFQSNSNEGDVTYEVFLQQCDLE